MRSSPLRVTNMPVLIGLLGSTPAIHRPEDGIVYWSMGRIASAKSDQVETIYPGEYAGDGVMNPSIE